MSRINIKSTIESLLSIWRYPVGSGIVESVKYLFGDQLITQEVLDDKRLYGWPIMKAFSTNKVLLRNLTTEETILDIRGNTFHSVQGGDSINFRGTLREIDSLLFYDTDCPAAIPYVTSFYANRPGMCISYEMYSKLNRDHEYHMLVDNNLNKGVPLRFFHRRIQGRTDKTILISSYMCHPAMVNNELTGPIMLKLLMSYISCASRHYSYLFVINPETIGSIAVKSWIENELSGINIVGGLVLTCLGKGELKLKSSIRSSIITHHASKLDWNIENFSPNSGSDERQYNSPINNIPVSSAFSLKYGEYREYHTSEDNLTNCFDEKDFLLSELKLQKLIDCIESDIIYSSSTSKCEPYLNDSGLYREINDPMSRFDNINTDMIRDIFSNLDGLTSESMIRERLSLDKRVLSNTLELLKSKGLIHA